MNRREEFYICEHTDEIYVLSQVSSNKYLLIGLRSRNRWNEVPINSKKGIPKYFKPFYGKLEVHITQDYTTVEVIERNF